MTAGSSPDGAAAGGADLNRALDSYSGFLAHQLAEVVVLLGTGTGADVPALAAARARLDRMLADLHDLRPPRPETAAVDLAALARETAAALGEPGRMIRVRAAKALPKVEGDPALLRALLAHVMRGALAASQKGVTLTLRATVRGDGRVEVQLEQPCDEGGAVDARRRLVPFERPIGTGPLLGAGVSGPASVRIVRAHGGALDVRDTGDSAVVVFDLAAAGS